MLIKIPIARPIIDKKDISIATKALRSGWISSQGPFIKQFEKKFQTFLGGGYPITASNGTSALELGIKALGINPGDEIIVPNFTFAASINSIINCGAIPKILDVERNTWTIDIKLIKKSITKKTRAIMLVHIYGQPCKIDEIISFAKSKNILIIEDCAEALGSKYKKKLVGLHGDCSCHSFFANKTITTGEGGMVVFKKKKYFNKAQIIKNHGMSKLKKYIHEHVGSNYRLTNIQAAIGISQLNKIKKLINSRKKIFKFYDNNLENELFEKLPSNSWSENSYWYYAIILKKKINREKLINKLFKKGIEIRTTFYPLNLMKPFKNYSKMSYKNSEYLGLNGICLPSSGLKISEQKYIVKTLNKELKYLL
tara:strand:- start:5063 stop:6166 length:1104 start_codon:yes stop_codon:yes gene_type:complete